MPHVTVYLANFENCLRISYYIAGLITMSTL